MKHLMPLSEKLTNVSWNERWVWVETICCNPLIYRLVLARWKDSAEALR